MASKVQLKCPICTKNVTKTNRSIECSYCEKYFHINCGKISVDQHDFLSRNRNLKYICEHCSRLPKYCNIQEELRNGFSALMKTLEDRFLEAKQKLDEQLESNLKLLDDKIKSASLTCDNTEQIKLDIKSCFDVINVVDTAANQRLTNLEKENNILQRRLNRSNIIISGLPKKIKDLRKPILKICSLCNVLMSHSDIQHCTYFAGGKKVLVKFNSVQNRDNVMINFHKRRNIRLKDVIGGSLESNVFLNDHFTEAAKKLISVCRKLKEEKRILKYTFINYDVPKVKIIMMDNVQKTLVYEQCLQLLDGGDLNDCTFSSVNGV